MIGEQRRGAARCAARRMTDSLGLARLHVLVIRQLLDRRRRLMSGHLIIVMIDARLARINEKRQRDEDYNQRGGGGGQAARREPQLQSLNKRGRRLACAKLAHHAGADAVNECLIEIRRPVSAQPCLARFVLSRPRATSNASLQVRPHMTCAVLAEIAFDVKRDEFFHAPAIHLHHLRVRLRRRS